MASCGVMKDLCYENAPCPQLEPVCCTGVGLRLEREQNFPEASTQSRLIELEEDLKKGLAPLKRQGWLGRILLSQGQVVVVPLSS